MMFFTVFSTRQDPLPETSSHLSLYALMEGSTGGAMARDPASMALVPSPPKFGSFGRMGGRAIGAPWPWPWRMGPAGVDASVAVVLAPAGGC